ncbi:hypothetical protein ACFP2F_06795 [Hymenobacter artigasi]
MILLLFSWGLCSKYLSPAFDVLATKIWKSGDELLVKLFPAIGHDAKIVVAVATLFVIPVLFGTWIISHNNKVKARKQNQESL